MAFDGIVIASLVHEFNQTIAGGKIAKIAQPEKDELLFTIKNQQGKLPAAFIGQPQPSAGLPDRQKQKQPSDCAEFLYAAEKAHWKRKNYFHHPARSGAGGGV